MPDRDFESYKKRVFDRLKEFDQTLIPESWWETVIRHYYVQGYSAERTVTVIMETLKKT